jgi:hypothetical protein
MATPDSHAYCSALILIFRRLKTKMIYCTYSIIFLLVSLKSVRLKLKQTYLPLRGDKTPGGILGILVQPVEIKLY